MPLKSASREPDSGLRFLEEKLSIYVQGAQGRPGHRRNPALDLLTGRVPDQRVQAGGPAAAAAWPAAPRGANVEALGGPTRSLPQTLVIPMAAAALAARPVAATLAAAGAGVGVARVSPSPWLQPSLSVSAAVPRIRFDGSIPQASGAWRVGRRLLLPLAAGLMLVAGVGLARGLAQPGETIVVPAPRSSAPATAAPAQVAAGSDGSRPTGATAGAGAAPASSVGGAGAGAALGSSVGGAEVSPARAASTGAVDSAPARAQVTSAPASPVPSDQLRVLLDERFAANERGWTSDQNGVAWLAEGAYHLFARQPTRFVAVGVPGTQDLADVVVSGHFRKAGGPSGGGYGLIVRDQVPDRGDGQSQAGPFYVFEVGDKGELGVWLRADDGRWVDLLPWTASEAINPGPEANELTVSAIGDRLSFLVNGVPVATQLDTVLHHGGVAIFTGGDGNQVVLDRLTVRTPR